MTEPRPSEQALQACARRAPTSLLDDKVPHRELHEHSNPLAFWNAALRVAMPACLAFWALLAWCLL